MGCRATLRAWRGSAPGDVAHPPCQPSGPRWGRRPDLLQSPTRQAAVRQNSGGRWEMDLSELYRDIVESSPDGLWVVDLEGRTVYANPEIARMHRIGAEELAALTVFDTLDEV